MKKWLIAAGVLAVLAGAITATRHFFLGVDRAGSSTLKLMLAVAQTYTAWQKGRLVLSVAYHLYLPLQAEQLRTHGRRKVQRRAHPSIFCQLIDFHLL